MRLTPRDAPVQAIYEKLLVFYELDLGLTHVVRKWSDSARCILNLHA